jgi:integrase
MIVVCKKRRGENLFFDYVLALVGLTTGMRNEEIGNIKKGDIKYVIEDNYFYLKVYNHKTEYYNVEETDEYRKIPLHHYVIEVLKEYIKEKEITENETYLFGTPKLNEDTNAIEGVLPYRKTHRAIRLLYKAIKCKEIITEIGIGNENERVKELLDENIDKEMGEKNITFYSLRHTFNTMCVLFRYNDTDTERSDDIIDFFMGHKIDNKMRANYTQINKVDKHTFYNNYGKFVIEMLERFIFGNEGEKQELENYADNFAIEKWEENKHLLNEDGKMDYEIVVKNLLNPLIQSLRQKKELKDESGKDEVFLSE